MHSAFRYAGANEHGHLYLSSLSTPTSNIPMPTPLSEQHYNDDSSSEEPDAPLSLEDHLRVSTDVLYLYPNADAPQELQREASKLRAEMLNGREAPARTGPAERLSPRRQPLRR